MGSFSLPMSSLESGPFTFTNQSVLVFITPGQGNLLQYYEEGAKSYLHVHIDVL